MEDVQYHAPEVALAIDRVGVRDLTLPLLVRDRAQGTQHTVASVDAGVDLPAHFKGTHMSRFVQALEAWDEEISYQSIHRLLANIKSKLEARKAWVRFSFPYFIHKAAPATGIGSSMSYQCRITAELDEKGQSFQLDLAVPVMTVCPCSKAISREGAHSQRATVHIRTELTGFAWLEDFIRMAEKAGSCELYSLLKREDEKFVTEHAFAHAYFVEDVVRQVARSLAAHPQVGKFSVEVESMESIHNHNAFARIEGQGSMA